MKFFSEVRSLFQNIAIAVDDKLNTTEISFSISYSMLPSPETFRSILNLVPKRDSATIKLVNDSNDIVILTSHQTNSFDYSSFTSELLPEDNVTIRIQIDKAVENDRFTIYDYESFATDLLARSLPEIMKWFSSCLSGQEHLMFEVLDCDVSFATRTTVFESSKDTQFALIINRCQRLYDCKNTSCFYNMNTFELLPDDFIVQGVARANIRLKSFFVSWLLYFHLHMLLHHPQLMVKR